MDNIDSSKGLNDFLPIQDWFNEMHAKNTSQKLRTVPKSKGESGISLANNVTGGIIGYVMYLIFKPLATKILNYIGHR